MTALAFSIVLRYHFSQAVTARDWRVCLFVFFLLALGGAVQDGFWYRALVVAAWEGTWSNTEGTEYTKENILILLQRKVSEYTLTQNEDSSSVDPPGCRNFSCWTSSTTFNMSTAILRCFSSFKYSSIRLGLCCYLHKLSLGLGCFLWQKLNVVWKNIMREKTEGEGKTFGPVSSLICFPGSVQMTAFGSPLLLRGLLLINWFVILIRF